jgi:5,10-methylenetetrahydromethanopterin reductase
MSVRIGVSFDGFEPFGQALETAKAAVAAGAKSLWMAEHLGYRDAIVSCTAFLLATRDAVVVPTAVSPYVTHPMPHAMMLATMGEAAPGRVAVALGTGNPLFLQESGAEVVKPLKAMREFIECLTRLWSGAPARVDGELFRLNGARMAFVPPAPVPIYVAAMREQMMRLGGRTADGVVLSAGVSAGFSAISLGWAREGAAAAGRDPAKVRAAAYLYTALSHDGQSAVELLRGKLAFLFRNKYLADNIRHAGLPIDHAAIIDAVARRDAAGAAALVPDEAVEAFAVGGTPRQARDRLQAYIAAGVEEPVLVVLGGDESRRLALDLVRDFA